MRARSGRGPTLVHARCSDFRFVVENAGFDPEVVQSRYQAQLALEQTLQTARAA
jgi:hypothetical protein